MSWLAKAEAEEALTSAHVLGFSRRALGFTAQSAHYVRFLRTTSRSALQVASTGATLTLVLTAVAYKYITAQMASRSTDLEAHGLSAGARSAC